MANLFNRIAMFVSIAALLGNTLLAQDCTPLHVIEGGDGTFAYAIASAGDFNNDGFDDIVVGDWIAQVDMVVVGKAYVVSGADGSPLLIASGIESQGWLGYSVAGDVDINGDGFDDIIIGAPRYNNGGIYNGSVFVIFGPKSGSETITNLADVTIEGTSMLSEFGTEVVGQKSLSSEYDLVFIGTPQYGTSSGAVFRFSGEMLSSGGTFLDSDGSMTEVAGGRHAHFGEALADAGDINGDNVADLIVGAPVKDNSSPPDYSEPGRVYVFLGSEASMPATTDYADMYIFCWDPGARLGSDVAGAGDIDGDGYSDILVSAPDKSPGYVYLFKGSASPETYVELSMADLTLEGPDTGGRFGTAISGAGLFDDDEIGDIAVTDTAYGSQVGMLYVYSGQDGSSIIECPGSEPGARFGRSMTGLLDCNNDGAGDVALGAVIPADVLGRLYIFDGHPSEAFVTGDADGSGEVDIDDVVYLIAYIFSGGSAPDPVESGDADCAGGVDIDDVVYIITYIFSGGPPPGDPDNDGVPDC